MHLASLGMFEGSDAQPVSDTVCPLRLPDHQRDDGDRGDEERSVERQVHRVAQAVRELGARRVAVTREPLGELSRVAILPTGRGADDDDPSQEDEGHGQPRRADADVESTHEPEAEHENEDETASDQRNSGPDGPHEQRDLARPLAAHRRKPEHRSGERSGHEQERAGQVQKQEPLVAHRLRP